MRIVREERGFADLSLLFCTIYTVLSVGLLFVGLCVVCTVKTTVLKAVVFSCINTLCCMWVVYKGSRTTCPQNL